MGNILRVRSQIKATHMDKLTLQEWDQLTREEKRSAIINFREPENIYRPQKYDNRIYREEKN